MKKTNLKALKIGKIVELSIKQTSNIKNKGFEFLIEKTVRATVIKITAKKITVIANSKMIDLDAKSFSSSNKIKDITTTFEIKRA